ncbi:hypothetical protein P261_02722 [Lachnospiraceae bacterium TWA4]|nr:hypothetical protein P261_02722 [Lachnospiraceae bacterium TWA4]
MRKQQLVSSLFIIGIGAMLGFTGCSNGTSSTPTEVTKETTASSEGHTEHVHTKTHKIAVATYNPEDEEFNLFKDYYNQYLAGALDVKFYYSDALLDQSAVDEFIEKAKKEGCEGIISYATYDLESSLKACGDDLYFAVGSAYVNPEVFDKVKSNTKFVGVNGPSEENEEKSWR